MIEKDLLKPVVGIEVVQIPAQLSSDDIRGVRNNTAALISAMHLWIEDGCVLHGYGDKKRNELERAGTIIHEFLDKAIGLDLDDQDFDTEKYKQNFHQQLEKIPQSVMNAILELSKHIPEIGALFTHNPNDATHLNLIFIMFQRAIQSLNKKENSLRLEMSKSERRAIDMLNASSKEDAGFDEGYNPHPLDLADIQPSKIRDASAQLCVQIEKDYKFMSAESKKDADLLLEFLSMFAHPEQTQRSELSPDETVLYKKIIYWIDHPSEINFGVLPEEICDAASRLQAYDPNLNMAFLGYERNMESRARVLLGPNGAPIPAQNGIQFNPFRVAAHNTGERESLQTAGDEELLKYDLYRKIVSGETSVRILNAYISAQIERATKSIEKRPTMLERIAFSKPARLMAEFGRLALAVMGGRPTWELRKRQIQHERDVKTLGEWMEELRNAPKDFLKIYELLIKINSRIELQGPIIHKEYMELKNLFGLVLGEYASKVVPGIEYPKIILRNNVYFAPNAKNILDNIRQAWLDRFYCPRHLRSVVRKEKYEIPEVVEDPDGINDGIVDIQIFPDGTVVAGHTGQIYVAPEPGQVSMQSRINFFQPDFVDKLRLKSQVFPSADPGPLICFAVNPGGVAVVARTNCSIQFWKRYLSQPNELTDKQERSSANNGNIQIIPDSAYVIDDNGAFGLDENSGWKSSTEKSVLGVELGDENKNLSQLQRLPDGNVVGLSSNLIFIAGKDGVIEKDINKDVLKLFPRFPSRQHPDLTIGADFPDDSPNVPKDLTSSADGKTLAAIIMNQMVIWEQKKVETGSQGYLLFYKYIHVPYGHMVPAKRIFQILPDKRILYQGHDGALLFRYPRNGAWDETKIVEPNKEYGEYTVARITPDGKLYVGTAKGKILVFDGEEKKAE